MATSRGTTGLPGAGTNRPTTQDTDRTDEGMRENERSRASTSSRKSNWDSTSGNTETTGDATESASSSTAADQPSYGAAGTEQFENRQRGNGPGQPAADLRRMVREATNAQLGRQKERATRSLGFVARTVRNTTDELRSQGQEGLADFLQRQAGRLDEFASRLEEKDLDEVVREVQNFARRNPALFIGAAFGVGVLLSRILRSTSTHQPRALSA